MPRPSSRLVFFPEGTTKAHRRGRVGMALVLGVTALMLVWPVQAWIPLRPLVLGLPASFAWVIGWLFVIFGALIALYRSEDH
ncbi:MAG: hypothetical protein AAGI71_17380 [Bacteroidota bacterium]